MFSDHCVQLALFLKDAPLTAAVDHAPVRFTDHEGEIGEVIEIDAIGNGAVGGIKAGKLDRKSVV